MTRLITSAVLGVALLTACETDCYESCQDDYDFCIESGNDAESCSAQLQVCEASCEPDPQY